MSIDSSKLLEAVNAGVAEASSSEPAPVAEPEVGADDEHGEIEAPEGAEAPDAEAPAEDAAGGPAKAPEAKAAEPAKAAKPAVDPKAPAATAVAPVVPEKPKDHVNDPIPNALKPATKERMAALITTAKNLTTERDTLKRSAAERDEIVGMITETRATPEQYGQVLDYLRLVNSANPADSEKALQMMQAELDGLARRLGRSVPGVDFLGEHADLRHAVDTGQISEQHANELAAARAHQVSQQTAGAAYSQQEQAQRAHQAEVTRGKQALNALEAQLKATDPQYEAKSKMLVPLLRPVFKSLPPSQWGAAFAEAYRSFVAPVAAPVAAAAPRVPQNTPLRPGNPAGAQTKVPSTLREAVDASLTQRQ